MQGKWFIQDVPGEDGCKYRNDVDENIDAVDAESFDTVCIKNKGDSGCEDGKFEDTGKSSDIERDGCKIPKFKDQPEWEKIDDTQQILVGDDRSGIVLYGQLFQYYDVTNG